MGVFEPANLLIVLLLVLVLFGGRKIPRLARGVAQGLDELLEALSRFRGGGGSGGGPFRPA